MSSNPPQEADGVNPDGPGPNPTGQRFIDRLDPKAIDAFCEYLRELEIDPTADWNAYLAKNSAYEEELQVLLEQYERVTAILERLTPSASFSVRLRQHYGDSVDPGISLSGDRQGDSGERAESTRASGQMMSRLSALNPDSSRYELRQEIARGGMGAIMEVWDRELRRTLAMKVVLGGKAAPGSSQSSEDVAERRLSRFLEEAQITGQLDHPGIVPVHDIGIDASARVYFTMQLIDGHDLRKVFEMARMEKGGWNQARVISVFVRVCEAMAYAHSKDVVHRDLKPANIMVGAFGEAYVMDWGLAKVRDQVGTTVPQKDSPAAPSSKKVETDRSGGSSTSGSPLMTLDGDIVGTPSYMAPEQARGKLEEIGFHSDIYSMGAMLYHLLSGHAPYEPLGEKVPAHTILDAVRKAPPWPLQRLNPDVDNELSAICEKAMSRDPKLRYESMLSLGSDLRAWVEGRGVGAYTTGVLYETRKWMSRNKATTTAIGTIVFLMGVSVALFIYLQQSNFSNLESVNKEKEAALVEAEDARADADSSLANALKSADDMKRERERAERQYEEAREQKLRADQNLEQANISQALAARSKSEAEATAYRSSITAATYSLRLNEIDAVRQNLDACPLDARGWEWHHLNLAADPKVGDLIVAGENVTDLAASQDGELLLTYGFALKPRVWSVKDRSRLAVNINSPGFVLGAGSKLRQLRCALSPDASIVAVTNPTDNSVRLFNGTTGDIMDRLSPGDQPIMTAVFSPDGRELGVADEAGAVFVIETGLTPVVREFEGHDESVNGLDFSQDGSRLVTCSSDLTAKIWDSRTTELILTLPEHHTDDLTAVAWSPVGDQITTASLDGSLIVWSAETGEILSVMHGHRGPVLDLVYSLSGELIYSGGSDRTVRMWEASTGRELRVFNGHEAGVRGLVGLSEGGVASVDAAGVIRCWDRRWDASVTSVEGCEEMSFGKIAFGAQNMMVHGATGTRRLEVMDGAEARHVGPLFGEAVGAEVGAAHGTFARATAADILAVATNDGRVLIYDSEGLQLIQEFKGFNESVTLMEISADGQVLVACGRRRDPVIIDMATKRRTEIGLRSAVTALALSEDGRYAAFAENDESIRVFDTDSGTVVGAHRDSHSNRITDLAISADGELLASVSNDKTARLWSMPTLEFHGSELPVHREQVTCVEFSPTEGRLATGSADGRIRVHDIDNQAVVFTLLAHERPILDLCFSSDGKRLAAAGLQSGVKIWETGEASGRYQSRFGRAESDEN